VPEPCEKRGEHADATVSKWSKHCRSRLAGWSRHPRTPPSRESVNWSDSSYQENGSGMLLRTRAAKYVCLAMINTKPHFAVFSHNTTPRPECPSCYNRVVTLSSSFYSPSSYYTSCVVTPCLGGRTARASSPDTSPRNDNQVGSHQFLQM